MITILARNVQQALPEGCLLLREKGVQRDSRNGPVLVAPCPVTTMYARPTERVIFWPERDANPFFHLAESLWMCAGRNDVEFVEHFARQMAQYSDDGKTLRGAYGHRWREHFGFDQLAAIAQALRANPLCRRQVLTMWDAKDLLAGTSKDVPCNTQAYLQRGDQGELNLMVCNRSNDMIWGAYGANAVHFSFMQELVAGMIGCPVGAYWQCSMNTHAYLENHAELLERMAAEAGDPVTKERPWDPYELGRVHAHPIISGRPGAWMRELKLLLAGSPATFDEPFFQLVARPMLAAHAAHLARDYGEAYHHMNNVVASDWRQAGYEWLQRREDKWTRSRG